ncbi:MAG: LysR family transcriptional regulator [Anaerovoracaceae bacterium]
MEIKQLEYFCAIVEAGSITEASRRIHMSQPPLSYSMKKLESELGVTLFERGKKNITLTEAGRVMYRRACDILEYVTSAKQEVAAAGRHVTLRLGITPTVQDEAMPVITEFAAEFPDVRYELSDRDTYALCDLLEEGAVDGAFIRTPFRDGGFEAVGMRRNNGMIAVAAVPGGRGERAGKERAVTLEELAEGPIIIYRRYSELILRSFRDKQLEPDVFCMCDDGRDALQLAAKGLGTAIVPDSMRSMASGLGIREIKEESLETSIVFAWKKGNTSEPLASFISVIKKTAAGQLP